MKCPDCNGDGKSLGATTAYWTTGRFIEVKCHRCRGTGAVPAEMLQWRSDGKQLKQLRTRGPRGYMNLVEASDLAGVAPTMLSDMERGIIPVPIEFLTLFSEADAKGIRIAHTLS